LEEGEMSICTVTMAQQGSATKRSYTPLEYVNDKVVVEMDPDATPEMIENIRRVFGDSLVELVPDCPQKRAKLQR
jgi:hypothetical protein